jgi:hypothetical protein
VRYDIYIYILYMYIYVVRWHRVVLYICGKLLDIYICYDYDMI